MRGVALGLLSCLSLGCTPVGESTPAEDTTPALEPPTVEVTPEPEPDGPIAMPGTGAEPEPVSPPEPVACEGVPASSLLPAHPALVLDVKTKARRTIELGRALDLTPSIRNDSKSDHHFAVASGDGSQEGWREPHVWYSGYIDAGDGCWRPLESIRVGRCGMYDEHWLDEVVDLAPGQSAALEWISSPARTLDISEPGRVRLFLHYAYRAGANTKGSGVSTTDLGPMADVGAFEIVSEAVEFELRQTLRLHLAPKAFDGTPLRLSEVATLKLENVAGKPRTVMAPTANTLTFEVEGEKAPLGATWNAGDETLPSHRLGVGRSVSLLGRSSPNPALEVPLRGGSSDTLRVRAVYQPYGEHEAPPVKSAWVELELR